MSAPQDRPVPSTAPVVSRRRKLVAPVAWLAAIALTIGGMHTLVDHTAGDPPPKSFGVPAE